MLTIRSIVRHLHRKIGKPGKAPSLPPAKSKRYHVVHVPWQNFEDVEELLWRRHVYMDALMSIKAHFRNEYAAQHEGERSGEGIAAREEADFRAQLLANEEENRRIADTRSIREQQEMSQLEDRISLMLEERLSAEAKATASREAEVQALIDNSADFLTPENVEQKILEAMEHTVDHNYALDVTGNVYTGTHFPKYLEHTPVKPQRLAQQSASLKKVDKKLAVAVS